MARAVDDPRKLQGAVAQALAGGCDRLVVGGGDGTISCAAGQLATSGRRDESAEVKSWRARRVFIDACPSQLVAADGEIIGRTPIHVEVVPGALRLVRPANLPRHSGRD